MNEHIVWVDGAAMPFDEYMKTIGPAEAKRAAELHQDLQHEKLKGHDMKRVKISFYFDTYPHQALEHIFPTQDPGKKVKGQTRYKVTVEIPDPRDVGVDHEMLGKAVEVDDDEPSTDT